MSAVKKPIGCKQLIVFFLVEFIKYLIGFLLSTIVCVSFVAMNYLLRRTLNQSKLRNNLNTSLANTTSHILQIENNSTLHTLSCEFCYSLIWSSTSCLILVYPTYVCFYYIAVRSRKKPKRAFKVGDFLIKSLNVFKNPMSNYKKIAFDSTKSIQTRTRTPPTGNRIYFKRNYYLKVIAITLLWVSTGCLYMKAIELLYCIDVIILFSTNYSFIYMIKWTFLHHKFIPLRVNSINLNNKIC